MFLSIVIAVYNEQGNIAELTRRIYRSLGTLKVPFELIYVIDGTDRSFAIAKHLQRFRKNLKVDHSPKKRGFRNAFVKGFSMMSKKATHILTLDADLNHQPEEIERFIKGMKETGADVIVGSRYLRRDPRQMEGVALWKKLVSGLANIIIRLWWNVRIKDKTSGFRLYRREVIERIIPYCKSPNFEFLFEIVIVAEKMGYTVGEVPIRFIARKHGTSKFEFWRVVRGYMRLMFRRYPLMPLQEKRHKS